MTIHATRLLLLGALAFGCNPDTDQPGGNQPGEEIECLSGVFTIAVAPDNGAAAWPKWAEDFPATLKADLKPKINPLGPTDITARPPYTVKVDAPVAGDDSKTAPPPNVMPLDTDGTHWALADVKLSAGIFWKIVFNVTDADGKTDVCEYFIDAT